MRLELSPMAIVALTTPAYSSAQYLAFETYGYLTKIADNPVAYDQNQNHAAGVWPTISADHTTLHSTGNRWTAYELPTPLVIEDDSTLQFSFTLNEETDKGFQAICLDADRELTGSNGKCFVLSTTQGWLSNMINAAELTAVNETTYHSIPVGHFLTGTVSYLAFLQDSDGTDRSLGDSSISDLKLVHEDYGKMTVEIGGVEEQLDVMQQQVPYTITGQTQDTSDWLMMVTEDGEGVQSKSYA